MKNNNILLFLASDKFSEIEFKTVKYALEKRSIRIFITSDANSVCVGDSGMKVKPDVNLFNVHAGNFSALIIIGGDGIKKYWNDSALQNIARSFDSKGKIIAAICSAPVILANCGLLENKTAACFKNDSMHLTKSGVNYSESSVVEDSNIITGQSPASAKDFADKIISRLFS
ncbi:MAG: DJ-1/PfpI family protein [Bacteroidetes bacterium]|nr:DJ-1/PfpI family protein [Bacteroidota bacterium]